jgi:hypothetical protein
MNIYLRPSSGEAGGLVIAAFGKQIHDQIYELVMDTDEYGEITDVEDGRDIILKRKGTGLDTEYDIKPAMEKTPLVADPKIAAEILDRRADLTKYAVGESIAKVIAKLDGDTENEEAEKEEEVERKVTGKPAGRRPTPVADDVEVSGKDADDTDAVEESEEDTPPARSAMKSKSTSEAFAALRNRLGNKQPQG